MNKIFLSILMLISITSCTKKTQLIDNGGISAPCEKSIIVDKQGYTSAVKENVQIIEYSIFEDCLTLKFGASGCDGSSWDIKLYDSGDILESYPLQRNAALSIKNTEECLALIEKEESFDISTLRAIGPTNLHIGEITIPIL